MHSLDPIKQTRQARRPLNSLLISGGILFILLLGICLAGEQLAPHDPLAVDLMHRLAAPSVTYLLGTDQLGRCILSRILCGARNSLASALAAVTLALGIGLPLGLLA